MEKKASNAKQNGYAVTAQTIIKNLKKRAMEGYYVNTAEEAVELLTTLLPKQSSVAVGGSATLNETKIINLLKSGNYQFIDRDNAKDDAMKQEIYAKTINADAFFMSSNAITLDGELINIDGTGNRVSFLIFGPKNVYVIVGMNKLVTNEEDGIRRVRNIASPPNAMRLNRNTPCAITGQCGDCLSPDCICCNTIITRKSATPGRIKVILIGESYGF